MKRIVLLVVIAFFAFGVFSTQGAEAKTISKKEFKELVANPTTARDHLKIARYYHEEAVRLQAKAAQHEDMMSLYKNPIYSSSKFAGSTIDHCKYFMKTFNESAVKMNELAAIHEEMAKSLETK